MRSQVLKSVLAATLLASPAAADVHVTMTNGTVTVSAKDATVREILAEWARVGQTRIVNVERVTGAPVSLELVDVPEAQALDTILRSVSGYLAAPRTTPIPNASAYDRIFLLPVSTGTAPPVSTAAASPSPFVPAPFQPADDQNEPVVIRQRGAPILVPGQARGPLPIRNGSTGEPFDPPVRVIPEQVPGVASPSGDDSPAVPIGVPTPGMIVPAPQQQTPQADPRRQ